MSDEIAQLMRDGWAPLCALAELPRAGGRYVAHEHRSYAVFRVGADGVRVTEDACPHAGVSLSAGNVEGGCVTCIGHAWQFSLDTGRCTDNPEIAVRTFPAQVVDGRVWAKIKSGGR